MGGYGGAEGRDQGPKEGGDIRREEEEPGQIGEERKEDAAGWMRSGCVFFLSI